jgi:hypothetical protein
MPSPIAHLASGYLAYRIGRHQSPRLEAEASTSPLLLLTAALYSLLPDVDSIAGLLLGDFGRYHNNGTHSLLVGLALSLIGAALIAWKRQGFALWFLLAASCYGMHVLMDAATPGRGVMALWPLSERRFLLPLPLFYGLHWSDGWFSLRHLWTALTEILFAVSGLLLWSIWLLRQGGAPSSPGATFFKPAVLRMRPTHRLQPLLKQPWDWLLTRQQRGAGRD